MSKEEAQTIWLASYPRSGNTWLRFAIAHLLNPEIQDSGGVADNIPEIGSEDDALEFKPSGRAVVKTHLLYGSQQLEQAPPCAGFIYIVRNPIDVMIANYHYHILKMGEVHQIPPERYYKRYLNTYLNEGGDPRWREFGFGSWMEHHKSWTDHAAKKHPHFIFRYEDMKRTPMLVMEGLNTFLNLKRSRSELEAAQAFASMGNMKKMEEKEIQNPTNTLFSQEKEGLGYEQGLRFVNKGQSNRAHELPISLRRPAFHIFGGPLKQYGYL